VSRRRIERLRWRIARLINALPGPLAQCWPPLWSWVQDGPTDGNRLPWARVSPYCRQDRDEIGLCYCGKLRAQSTR
jgi:hypothetical protein